MTSSCCNFVLIYLDFWILICRGELQLTVEYLRGVFHVELGCGVCEGGGGVEEREVKRIWWTWDDQCDHTSSNAPDPIRSPQLSMLGRE